MSSIPTTLNDIVPQMETLDYDALLNVFKSLEGLLDKTKQLITAMAPDGSTPFPAEQPKPQLPVEGQFIPNFLTEDLSKRVSDELKGISYQHSMKGNSPSLFQYSDSFHYVYNVDSKKSTPQPLTPVMKELLAHANSSLNTEFNHILVNRYKNLNSCLGAHQDDEKQVDPLSPVATISFGAERRLRISAPPDHKTHKTVTDVVLKPRSCFMMLPGFQEKYFHALLAGRKSKPQEKGCRYSITLRKIIATPSEKPSSPPSSSPSLNQEQPPAPADSPSPQVPDTMVFGSSLTKGLNPKVLSKHDKIFRVCTDNGANVSRIHKNVKKMAANGQVDCNAITSVFFVCGGNDIENIRKDSDIASVQKDYKSLVDSAKEVFPNAAINLVSLVPRRTKYRTHSKNMSIMNTWLEKYCNESHCRFVNIFSFFLNRKGSDLNYKLFNSSELHFSMIGDSVIAKVLIAVANRPR